MINVAVIGLGRWGQGIVQAIQGKDGQGNSRRLHVLRDRWVAAGSCFGPPRSPRVGDRWYYLPRERQEYRRA